MHHMVKIGLGGIHIVEFGRMEVVHGNSQSALGKSETINNIVNMCSHIHTKIRLIIPPKIRR